MDRHGALSIRRGLCQSFIHYVAHQYSCIKVCIPVKVLLAAKLAPLSVPGSEILSEFLSQCDVDIPAAGELPNAEPEQADQHNAGAVQPADLQSSRLPRGGQHGAQVGALFTCFYTC